MSTFYIKEGATLPVLHATLSWTGSPSDLTNASTVQLRLKRDGAPAEALKTGAVVSASAKTIKYVWQAGDTAVPGTYSAEWIITFNDGTVLIVPSNENNDVRIIENLA